MLENEMQAKKRIESAVPAGRFNRLVRLGTLASGVAGGMMAEGARQFVQGKRPSMGDLLLTPANARRVAEQLAHLRGAAMKVGQLLSMDAGELLPPELAEILARLRSDAIPMPMSQVVSALNVGWGPGWEQHFERFSFTPMAAASIGQVHRARTREGLELAVKIQYPGVRRSIDSDVDNVASLLRLSGLLPKSLNIDPLLNDAKAQLHDEANYLREGDALRRYAALLADSQDFIVPALHAGLTRPDILAMTFVDGQAVESLVTAPQSVRDRVASLLIGLLFRELFEFRFVQTDPNFANYLYMGEPGRLALLDLGAARTFSPERVAAYRRLMRGALQGEREAVDAAAAGIGYFQTDILERQRRMVVDLFMEACEPLRHEGAYDFGTTTLAARIRDAGRVLSMDRDFWHTPPADAIFLHRKIGGLFLLAARLRARVRVGDLAMAYL